ncbi:TIGR03085 family metal-binding protein [Dactylosporangium sp. AC04546]|uniref:TIGR03085 family metal-binding protein n=1 Tax=Dactylosporangium sp. AC04546 TaxID=2862460 RepID=UPI001EDD090A|nr:TIGR03085 family metal-binding protein [Dactylosporangium sp. AC04546]WVK82081.1 TIGR03085 family metal-binding protein [Dactylosporangium sp. AC04546]
MTAFARAERAALADSLLAAGPDAPTLCAGWATRDLAAHLVLRERRPDAAAGILLKPLAGHTQRVQRRLAEGDYAALVEKVRTTPAWLRLTGADEAMNLVEYFIHHEDIRRAQPGWTPRDLPVSYEAALAGRTKASARLSARRFPATIIVDISGHEGTRVGRGGAEVTVTGAPGELLLFFTGRQEHARVEIDGPTETRERLRTAHLGL